MCCPVPGSRLLGSEDKAWRVMAICASEIITGSLHFRIVQITHQKVALRSIISML